MAENIPGNGSEIKDAQDKTILVVELSDGGQISWKTKLPPPQLNWIIDTIKFHILTPRGRGRIITPPSPARFKRFVNDVKRRF